MRGKSPAESYRSEMAAESELDLHSLGRLVAAKKGWIIGVTVLAFLATGIYVTLATPRYTGEAEVLLENQVDYFTGANQPTIDPTQAPPDDAAVASQVELLTSRDLARDAIKALELTNNPEFNPTGTSPFGRLFVMLGIARAPNDLSSDDRVLQAYFDHLNVSEVQKSRVLSVDFWSRDPVLAAKAANTIADLYIGVRSDAKRKAAQAGAASLATEIAALKSKVADADAKTAAFRASSGLLLGDNNTTIGAQQLADLTTQLAQARTAQADGDAKAHMIRDMVAQGRLDEVPDVANNDLIRAIETQRVSARSELALESQTLLPGHPRIKELTRQVADLDAQLKTAAEKTARTLENDAQIASARVTNLQAAINQQTQAAGSSSADSAQALQLDGDARLLRDQLEAEMTKYQEALARQDAQATPGDARVISRAAAPDVPSFPKKVPLMVFGTVAGFVLSLGAVVAGELLSGRPFVAVEASRVVRAEDDFDERRIRETETVAPVLEHATKEQTPPSPPPLVVSEDAEPASKETAPPLPNSNQALDDLVRRIGDENDSSRAVRLLVTSSTQAALASETALPLARALARERRTILVDLGAADTAGDPEFADRRQGLSELLDGSVSFAEVIHRDRGTRLHLLPVGSGTPTQWSGLDLILEALSQTYDYVVLAAPPVAEQGVALAVAGTVEYAVLASAGQGSDPATTLAHDELIEAGAAVVLVVTADFTREPLGSRARSAA